MVVKVTVKRIFFKLSVSLVTFTIGVSVAAIYSLYNTPEAVLPEVVRITERYSCFPGLSVRVVKSTAQTEYFPVPALSGKPWQFTIDWYSGQLKAMYEPPLSSLETEDESYRFLWLRSFHRPVMVHVWRTDSRHFIVVK